MSFTTITLAEMPHQQQSSSSSSTPKSSSVVESELPEILLDEIMGFLCFSEQRRFLGLSTTLWKSKDRIDKQTQQLTFQSDEGQRYIRNQPFQSETTLRYMFGGTLSTSLVSLTMDHCANDGFLHVAMVELGLFPNLKKIRMRSCDQITDFGLDCLSRSAAASSLETVDITFCPYTTYAGTFGLRKRLPNLKVIRRQPEWLDGKFVTPFGDNSTTSQNEDDETCCGEIHTYYADGSFTFDRDSQSNGFVCQLFPWDEDYIGDKLQYNNFRAPLGWPEWTQFCYRPGVCLLRIPPGNSDHEGQEKRPTVLVGQYMRGLRAPNNRRLMERAKTLVPLGQSRYFDKTTEELLPFEDAESIGEHHLWENVIMVSRMRVLPLDQLMPPPELVQACQNTCQGMQSYGRDFLLLQEERLNHLLSGEADF